MDKRKLCLKILKDLSILDHRKHLLYLNRVKWKTKFQGNNRGESESGSPTTKKGKIWLN